MGGGKGMKWFRWRYECDECGRKQTLRTWLENLRWGWRHRHDPPPKDLGFGLFVTQHLLDEIRPSLAGIWAWANRPAGEWIDRWTVNDDVKHVPEEDC
jgi:hypothetical protein